MSNPRYFYTLTPDDLMKSKNQDIKECGVNYSFDSRSAPMTSLQHDLGRNVRLHGRSEAETVKLKDASYISEDKFTAWIDSQFTNLKIPALLAKHYSQAPSMFISKALVASGSFPVVGDNFVIGQPTGEELTNNLYELNGSAYIKIKADRYPIISLEDKKILGYIQGPVEALFKLTEKGFELQHLSTNSDLIRDMYLGKPVSERRIMRNLGVVVNYQRAQEIHASEVILEKQEIELEKRVKQKGENTTDKDRLELASVTGALKAMQDYKTGKIDREDLHTAVSNYLKQAKMAQNSWMPQRILSRLFSSSPSTTDFLKKSLKDIERIQKAAMKQENTGLRR